MLQHKKNFVRTSGAGDWVRVVYALRKGAPPTPKHEDSVLNTGPMDSALRKDVPPTLEQDEESVPNTVRNASALLKDVPPTL